MMSALDGGYPQTFYNGVKIATYIEWRTLYYRMSCSMQAMYTLYTLTSARFYENDKILSLYSLILSIYKPCITTCFSLQFSR